MNMEIDNYVWILCSGEQVDEIEFQGNPISVYDASKVSIDEIEKIILSNKCGAYKRIDESWENDDEYVWFDENSNQCFILNKIKIKTNV